MTVKSKAKKILNKPPANVSDKTAPYVQADFASEAAIAKVIGGAEVSPVDKKHDTPEPLICISLRMPERFLEGIDSIRKQSKIIPSRNEAILAILEKAFSS